MARHAKAPAVGSAGAQEKTGHDRLSSMLSLETQRAQLLAVRYALPIETAATVAALAFGGALHG